MLGLGHGEMVFWLGVLFVSSLELRTWSNVPPDYQRGQKSRDDSIGTKTAQESWRYCVGCRNQSIGRRNSMYSRMELLPQFD
jgi:hypothetical protein